MPLSPHACFTYCALVAALVAAVFDARTGRIPNLVSLPPLVAAPLVHALVSGPGALGGSLLGALLCGAVPTFVFARGGMGGGDVKLFAALGALLGVSTGLEIELGSLWLAALCVCARLAWHGRLLATFSSALTLLWRRVTRRAQLASAPAPELQARFRLGAAIGGATAAVTLWESLSWASH
jgi:prepilin peptidase CpaA